MRNAALPQLMSGPADRHATLGAFGSPIHHQHAQLRAMLMARRRKDLADYFARPIQDTESGEIRWLAEVEGTPGRFEQLSAQDAPAVRDKLARIQSDLAALAQSFRSLPGQAQATSGTGPAFAAVLDGAQRVPETGDFLFVVAGQPVIAFWGFRDHQGQGVIPTPPPLPISQHTAAAPAVASVAPVLPAAPGAATETSDPPRRGLAWLWWLLLLLLLLALAAWWFFGRPHEPAVAPPPVPPQTPAAVDPPGNALPATEGREASAPIALSPEALARGDLSFLQGLWQVGKGRISLYSSSPDNVTGSARDVLEFGPDGRGKHHTLEGMSHGRGETRGPSIAPCSGDLSASIEGKTLMIDLGPCMAEGSNSPQFAGRRFECAISGKGATECKTVNHDGHPWQTDLLRIN